MKLYNEHSTKLIYGSFADKLEEKLDENFMKFKMHDYTSIYSMNDLKTKVEDEYGVMYVYNNEIFVSTGVPYEWYRYKYDSHEDKMVQRFKVIDHDTYSTKDMFYDAITYKYKPTVFSYSLNKQKYKEILTPDAEIVVFTVVVFIILVLCNLYNTFIK
jgi:hypothetical protein